MRDGEGNEITEMHGPVQFAIQTPSSDERIKQHIEHALSLGLPEADTAQKALHLIANGPSAKTYDFEALANWHHSGEMALIDTAAVNGALKLFTDRGIAPTYWICCDPQETGDNQITPIDFLKGPLPKETIYLVASKCAPEVFERLKDRKVRLWHVNDQVIPGKRLVPCATSVTLSGLMLFRRLEYRRIDTWGWDCCFGEDMSHHAATGELGVSPDAVEIEIGQGPGIISVWTTPTWAAEHEDAKGILPVMRWWGADVVIHGRSMISAIIPEFGEGYPFAITLSKRWREPNMAIPPVISLPLPKVA